MSRRLLPGASRLAGSSLLRLQSDERLVALAAAGHEFAFAAIVERYRGELLRYCGRLLDPSRAEDAVQQALLNAHLAMPSVDPGNIQLRAWLHRIAHNAAVDVLRGSRSQSTLDDRLAAPGTLPEALEVRERLRVAFEAIARLPEPQRAALTLRAIEGRPHEEVAAALGVTPGAARQHVHRARVTLRAAVSALTPYSLLARFAMAGGGAPVPVGELAAGASVGAGATVAKVAAGVLAAGALAGGVTHLPVRDEHHATRPARTGRTLADAAGGFAGTTTARGGPLGRPDERGQAPGGHARTPGRGRHGSDSGDDRHGHGGEDRSGDRHGGRGPGLVGDDRSGRSPGGRGEDQAGSGRPTGDRSGSGDGSGSGRGPSSGSGEGPSSGSGGGGGGSSSPSGDDGGTTGSSGGGSGRGSPSDSTSGDGGSTSGGSGGGSGSSGSSDDGGIVSGTTAVLSDGSGSRDGGPGSGGG